MPKQDLYEVLTTVVHRDTGAVTHPAREGDKPNLVDLAHLDAETIEKLVRKGVVKKPGAAVAAAPAKAEENS